MSPRLVTPEDFGTEQPPERTVGIETEYDIRRPDGTLDCQWTDSFFDEEALGSIGLIGSGSRGMTWLSNGAYIYPDVGHLEYCTPESLGPAEAIAASHAGNLVLQRLVDASGEAYKIFRRSATIDALSGAIVTKGYHLNLGTPDQFCSPSTFLPIETHLATQFYAWGGLVTRNGYCISPKSFDIGNHITTIGNSNRTGQGSKPFGLIRSSADDSDTNATAYKLGRFEDRTKTPSSKWSDFMGAVTTSLLMRVIENPVLELERKRLQSLLLNNSITTLKSVAYDMPLGKTYKLADGRQMTALDLQENLAEIGAAAVSKLKLPIDEVYGSTQWLQIVDDFRKIQNGQADLETVGNRIGWAGKYVFLAKKIGDAALAQGDITAIRYCLGWDMVVPRGAGQIYDDKRGPDFIPAQVIERLAIDAPVGTRASARAEYIKEGGTKHSNLGFVRWPYVTLEQGEEMRMVSLHPYENRRPKLGGRHGRKW